MKEKLIQVKFKNDSDNAIIEIPKNILAKLHVNEENNYIYLKREYDMIYIRRGVKNEKKLWTEFENLIDKYYKYKKLDEKDTKRLFDLLRILGFIEFDDVLKTKKLENLEIIIIKTKKRTIKINSDHDVEY